MIAIIPPLNHQNHADLGFLMSPGDGAVTALALYAPPDAAGGAGGARLAPTHMLSGAADGSVTVWSAGKDWAELKTLTDHAAAVTALTVHDSGRVFLSTDAGGGLRLWSLVKGKAQFKTKLPAPADAALFAPPPAGDTYAIVMGDSVSVHSVEGGGRGRRRWAGRGGNCVRPGSMRTPSLPAATRAPWPCGTRGRGRRPWPCSSPRTGRG